MKQTIFTLLLFSTIGLISCRKHDNQLNIEQYDAQQIKSYIAANNITGMIQDATGGDTSGIYYKPILHSQANIADSLTYSDNISFVFTIRSFDGHYVSTDTIANHYQGFVGHIISDALPVGLELAVLNDLKYPGASMRVLIPSHLAYGVNGYGTGSITNTSSRIAGNQCLDYYIHVIAAQPDAAHWQDAYDEQVIKNYITANNLTGYLTDTVTANDGSVQNIYYNVTTAGTDLTPITDNTTAEVNYTGRLLNNVAFDTETGADSVSFQIPGLIKGVTTMLKRHATKGTVISLLIPSGLGYGTAAQTGIPANSPLRFDFHILNVYNY